MQKEHWYEKYRKDTDEKTQELEQLKAMRNKDLERMQELTVKVSFKIRRYIVVLFVESLPCCVNVQRSKFLNVSILRWYKT